MQSSASSNIRDELKWNFLNMLRNVSSTNHSATVHNSLDELLQMSKIFLNQKVDQSLSIWQYDSQQLSKTLRRQIINSDDVINYHFDCLPTVI